MWSSLPLEPGKITVWASSTAPLTVCRAALCCHGTSWRNSMGQVAPMGTAVVLQLGGTASHRITDLHLCHIPAVRTTCLHSNGFNHPYIIGSQGSLWGVSACCSFGIILGSCHNLNDKGSLRRVFHTPATSVLLSVTKQKAQCAFYWVAAPLSSLVCDEGQSVHPKEETIVPTVPRGEHCFPQEIAVFSWW